MAFFGRSERISQDFLKYAILCKTFLVSILRRRVTRWTLLVIVSFFTIHRLVNNHDEHVTYFKKTFRYYPEVPVRPYDINWENDPLLEVNNKYNTKLEPFKKDGSVNLKYFKKFKFHKDKITPEEVLDANNKLYDKVMLHQINEPRVDNLVRPPADPNDYERANATLMSLVRNSELDDFIFSMRQVERNFNRKFNYPWTLMNNRPFSAGFKNSILKETNAKVNFVVIPAGLWDLPDNINVNKMRKSMDALEAQELPYATKLSYRNMCRFNSGNFYNVAKMQEYKWYWRVEPEVRYFCDIDYDIFKFMEMNNKTYGFVTTLYEIAETIPNLWPTTLEFLSKNPQYLNKDAPFDWLLNDNQLPDKAELAQGYSTCHFWSNFEIANMDFYRGEAYSKWFEYLEEKGGFYYERWGDAPVHTVGVSLFESKENIHWFRDIGYHHNPYFNCPLSDRCHECEPGLFTPHENIKDQNCNPHWIRYAMTPEDLDLY